MRDYDILVSGGLFLAALRLLRPGPDPVFSDVYVFTRALQKLTAEGSKLAAKFTIYNSVVGPRAGDFDAMMSMLASSTQIAWLAPSFRQFMFQISPDFARRALDKADPVERAEAEALADAYLKGLV